MGIVRQADVNRIQSEAAVIEQLAGVAVKGQVGSERVALRKDVADGDYL